MACKHSLKILKVIKTRLRIIVNEDKLEAFMFIAANKEILVNIYFDQIVGQLRNKYELFLRKLRY